MQCPVCRALYRPLPSPSPNCRRCGADLSQLILLHDKALWHHRQAVQAFQSGDYAEAITYNQQALALHHAHPDFQALSGQLRALRGDFSRAVQAWRKARQINPQQPLAVACLQCLDGLKSDGMT